MDVKSFLRYRETLSVTLLRNNKNIPRCVYYLYPRLVH